MHCGSASRTTTGCGGSHAAWSTIPALGAGSTHLYRAVVPTITGSAWITGFAQYVVDPDDPFPNGYTVGDIWSAQPPH